jgi:hypothetical protein
VWGNRILHARTGGIILAGSGHSVRFNTIFGCGIGGDSLTNGGLNIWGGESAESASVIEYNIIVGNETNGTPCDVQIAADCLGENTTGHNWLGTPVVFLQLSGPPVTQAPPSAWDDSTDTVDQFPGFVSDDPQAAADLRLVHGAAATLGTPVAGAARVSTTPTVAGTPTVVTATATAYGASEPLGASHAVARLHVDAITGSGPFTAAVTDLSGTVTTGDSDAYAVDWGDGNTAAADTPPASHAYADAGHYRIRYTAELAAGDETVWLGRDMAAFGPAVAVSPSSATATAGASVNLTASWAGIRTRKVYVKIDGGAYSLWGTEASGAVYALDTTGLSAGAHAVSFRLDSPTGYLTATATVTTTSASVPSTTNVIAYYKFDNNLADAHTGHHDLTGVNSPTFVTGVRGQAVHLAAASTQSAGVTDAAFGIDPAVGWSLGCWVKFDTVSGEQTVASQGFAGTAFYLRLQGGRLQFGFGSFSGQVQADTYGDVPTDTLVYVLCEYDPGADHTTDGAIRLYVNNVLQGSAACTGAGGSMGTNFNVGTRLGNELDGSADELFVAAQLYSSDERSYLYGGGTPPAFPWS